MSLGFVFVA